MNDTAGQFLAAMRAARLDTRDKIIGDGTLRRFHVEGDGNGTRNGWYVLFDDERPAGEFGSWKLGIQATWIANDNSISDADRSAAMARIEEARKQREAEERARQKAAAERARAMWDMAEDAPADHPYLIRKGIASAHGLRVCTWPLTTRDGEVFARVRDSLLVPIMDGKGAVWSLQAIFPEPRGEMGRDKDFLRDGKKRGLFATIGKPDGKTVAIVEGWATGATVHEATGWFVVVAFDAGNLQPVAEFVREQNPGALIVICADNDQWTHEPVENPGVTRATAAGNAVRARVIVPQFADLSTKPTDFNDLAALGGIEEARRQLTAHEKPAAQPEAPAQVPAPANRNVDYFTPLPDVSAKGKPLATIENVAEICNRMNVRIRYNVISKEEEILIPGASFSVDNAANASLAWMESECARFSMPTEKLGGFITYLADRNLYNPVAQWIKSKPWDGVSRLRDLFDTITPVEDKRLPDGRSLRDVLILRWLLSAVAAAFNPDGVAAHGVLVLQGPQYLGKTAWFKRLVPSHMSSVLQDGMILRPDDRDSVKQVCSFWLVELGELDATFRKSDIAALKSFLTRKNDVLRRAYAKKDSQFARRTVFFGSVNPREYLHDPTGNRRYWTIECAAINAMHDIDMQQVFAELFEMWTADDSDGCHMLTPEEVIALNSHNEAFTAIDPIEERIQTKLDWQSLPECWEWKTSTEILLAVGVERPTQADATKAAHVMRKLNNGQGKRSNGKNLLLCPPVGRPGSNNDGPF